MTNDVPEMILVLTALRFCVEPMDSRCFARTSSAVTLSEGCGVEPRNAKQRSNKVEISFEVTVNTKTAQTAD